MPGHENYVAEGVLHHNTGKTLALLYKLHACAYQYPGASLVILRKHQAYLYPTVLQTFGRRILGPDGGGVNVLGGEWPRRYDYPNGSMIWTAGLDKAGKVLSAEHDIVYVNQAEELSLPDWETLASRTTGRAGHMPYSQLIGDCNPSSPTHWIRTRSTSGSLTLIESSHRDNPELYDPATGLITPAGEQRIGRLSKLTGTRKQRLALGLWVAPEGAIYDVFDESRHKVRSFVPPLAWPRAVGIDPFGAYIAAVWLAYDPQAQVLNVYREYYGPFGATTPGHVSKILEQSTGETIWRWFGGGPSERQARADFTGSGIYLETPPVDDVWAGIDRVYQLLSDSSLFIHDSCPQLLSEIGDYRRIMRDGQPTEGIENKEAYHALDALRYAIVGLSGPQDVVEVVEPAVQIGPRF